MAVFPDSGTLADAAKAMREKGYRRLDAFSPYPVEGLAEDILGMRPTRLPRIVLGGAIAGFALAYGLILYSVEIDYPINVGGRPLHSWPAFIVIGFEAAILGAALAGFFGTLAANGLPRYHHPVFNAPSFTFARGGKFYLLVEAADPEFAEARTKILLKRLGAETVEDVEA
jgi:hypothetical protein